MMGKIHRISASFNARVVQPWTLCHFEKTKYGKMIANYKGRYTGQRCFLIGNGPSLRAEDLTNLHNHHEITFAFNRVYNIFDATPWRPDFYISQDEKMLAGSVKEIAGLDLLVKLIPIQMKWYYNINIEDALYFNMNWRQGVDTPEIPFSDDAAHELVCAATGMYTAAQLAAYMGFTEIYLIGVDHHFRVSQNNNGEIVVDNTVKDYFSDNYNKDKDKLYIPNTERSTLTYVAMQKHCDARGIKVYNATRGGKLEVFPRVDFDTLF